ncbi:Crp/Fnr family transcriptional regulator [Spirosoma daeguense]
MFELLRKHIEKRIAITDEEFAVAESLFRPQKLRKKQFLLNQGAVCLYESFVVSGCLKSFYTDKQGTEHVLRFSVEDGWAGDIDSFAHATPASFSIQAIETTTLLTINKPALAQLYQQAPHLETFFRILNEKALVATSQRVIDTLSTSAQERYEHFLSTYPHLVQRVSLKDIASYLGVTPIFLSRLRQKR